RGLGHFRCDGRARSYLAAHLADLRVLSRRTFPPPVPTSPAIETVTAPGYHLVWTRTTRYTFTPWSPQRSFLLVLGNSMRCSGSRPMQTLLSLCPITRSLESSAVTCPRSR